MIISNEFEVSAPPEAAWPLLTDVAAVAPCLPGAQVRAMDEENAYQGELRVKLGPVSMTFSGEMRFIEMDAAACTATAVASAREARNRGSAQAQIDFAIQPAGDGSRVSVRTDLNLAGPAAQYGRGAGMLNALAEEMLAQFSACLHERLLDPAPGDADRPDAAPLNATGLAGKAALRRVRRALGTK